MTTKIYEQGKSTSRNPSSIIAAAKSTNALNVKLPGA
jgi:hypothetical protein